MSKQPNQSIYFSETELILSCAHTHLTEFDFEKVATLLKLKLDWNYIFKISNRNAILPLISSNLIKNFGSRLPAEINDALKQEFQIHTQKNMFLTGKLVELIRLFNSHDIPVLPFKGPLLSIQAYNNLALRNFIDLDVLIPVEHLKTAVDLLTDANYRPLNIEHLNNLNNEKDIGFISHDRQVRIELHWKLSGRYFSIPLEMSKLWSKLEKSEIGGIEVNNLNFNTLLIYLCLHGSRHSWERLGWICDINQLIKSKSNIDWESVFTESKRLGCEKVVGLGLCLVNQLFGLKIPHKFWKRIENDPIINDLADQILVRLFENQPNNFEIGERYLYHLKLKERFADKWSLHFYYLQWYLRIILSPNENDTKLFNLPPFLSPLNYLLRPSRLLFNYLFKSKKSQN